MAYVQQNLGVDSVAFARRDEPVVLSDNQLIGATAKWTDGGSDSEADITSVALPVSQTLNGSPHYFSQPVGQTGLDVYLNFFFPVGINFDSIFMKFYELTSGEHDIEVHIADSADFVTNFKDIARFHGVAGGTNPIRLVGLRLGDDFSDPKLNPQAYTGVNYLRIKIQRLPAIGTTVRLGELIIGQRRQWHRKLLIPFDDKPGNSITSDFTSRSRVRQRFVYASCFRDIEGTYHVGGKPNNLPLTDLEVYRAMYNDSSKFNKPFVYIENPGTEPKEALLSYKEDSELRIELQGPFERSARFDLEEVPPFLGSEVEVSALSYTTAATLPGGTVSVVYGPEQLVGAGGYETYVFEHISGALPPGLSFDILGNITGTPTQAGTFNFTIRLRDQSDDFFDQQFTLTVV